jgi:hypothetical protein
MAINGFRRVLYALAKGLGDVQALTSKRKNAIPKRIGRRIVGKITGRAIGKLFR